LHPIENAAASFDVQTIEMPLRNITEIEPALKSFAQNPNAGLVILADSFIAQHHNLFIKLTAQYRLPAVYPFSHFVKEGGLISYGINRTSEFRRAAAYIDLILRVKSRLIFRFSYLQTSSWWSIEKPLGHWAWTCRTH
jgi:ABC-type uncharacterized transport system substrate-binding protein